MRRVDAQIQGMSKLPTKSGRRTHAENKDLESLFLDPEGVQKRREHLLEMMKQDRRRRQDEGDQVSSSDDERDMRRVDAQLVGMSRGDTERNR